MNTGYTQSDRIAEVTDVDMGGQENIRDSKVKKEVETEKKKRAQNKDRSDGELSESSFMALSRAEQLELADKYWNGRTNEYDKDKKFQFSYTHLDTLCERLVFRKGVVDTGIHEGKNQRFTLNMDAEKRPLKKRLLLVKTSLVNLKFNICTHEGPDKFNVRSFYCPNRNLLFRYLNERYCRLPGVLGGNYNNVPYKHSIYFI